jgi:hypothetical protein
LVNTPVNWSFSASALSTSLSVVVLFLVWFLEAEYSEYLFSPNILKELSNELTPIMTHFFQQTMDKSTLPEDWTTANICPLYKKADRSIPANYRPVSLTCICLFVVVDISSPIVNY